MDIRKIKNLTEDIVQQSYTIENICSLVAVIENNLAYAPTDGKEALGAIAVLNELLENHLEALNDIADNSMEILKNENLKDNLLQDNKAV